MSVFEFKYSIKEHGIPANCLKEISTLKQLSHPNIIGLEYVERQADGMCLTYDLRPRGAAWSHLADLLILGVSSGLDRVSPHQLAYQLLGALKHCHMHGIAHRAVNPSNIAISEAGVLKLAGFSSLLSAGPGVCCSDEALTMQPKEEYMSPEALYCAIRPAFHFNDTNVTKGSLFFPSDVWAAACVFLDVVRAKSPSGLMPLPLQGNETCRQVQSACFEQLSSIAGLCGVRLNPLAAPWVHGAVRYSSSLVPPAATLGEHGSNFLEDIFQYNPMKRATAEGILSHPFLVCGAPITNSSGFHTPTRVTRSVFCPAVDESEFAIRHSNGSTPHVPVDSSSLQTPMKTVALRKDDLNVHLLTEQHELRKMRLRQASSISLNLPLSPSCNGAMKRRLSDRSRLTPQSVLKTQKMT